MSLKLQSHSHEAKKLLVHVAIRHLQWQLIGFIVNLCKQTCKSHVAVTDQHRSACKQGTHKHIHWMTACEIYQTSDPCPQNIKGNCQCHHWAQIGFIWDVPANHKTVLKGDWQSPGQANAMQHAGSHASLCRCCMKIAQLKWQWHNISCSPPQTVLANTTITSNSIWTVPEPASDSHFCTHELLVQPGG